MCGLKAARGTEAFMSTYAQNQGSCTTGAITLLMTRRESAPRAAETLAPPGPPPARGGLRVPTGLTAGRDCQSRSKAPFCLSRCIWSEKSMAPSKKASGPCIMPNAPGDTNTKRLNVVAQPTNA